MLSLGEVNSLDNTVSIYTTERGSLRSYCQLNKAPLLSAITFQLILMYQQILAFGLLEAKTLAAH